MFLLQYGTENVEPFVCMFLLQYGTENVEPLVSEDKVMFGIHGHAKSVLTLAKIRKHFRKSDTRAVAKEVFLDQSLI